MGIVYQIKIRYTGNYSSAEAIKFIFRGTDDLNLNGRYMFLTVKKNSLRLSTDDRRLTEIVTENVRKSKRMLEIIDTEKLNKHRE